MDVETALLMLEHQRPPTDSGTLIDAGYHLAAEVRRLRDESTDVFECADGTVAKDATVGARQLEKVMTDKIPCPHCNSTGQVETGWACVVDGIEDPDDSCVLDYDRPQDCMYANPGMVRTECEYWQQIKVNSYD